MSTIKFENLNNWDTFKDFLKAYHRDLQEKRSFPPLGIQKALHTAAPIFGYSNAHEMVHDLEGKPSGSTAPAVDMSKDEITDVLMFVKAVNEAVENESVSLNDVAESMGLDMPEVYTLMDLSETLYAQVLRGELTIEPVEPKKPEKVKVMTVTVITGVLDREALKNAETKVMRSQAEVDAYIGDMVRTVTTKNTGSISMILGCENVKMPDDSVMEGINTEELIEWIIDNHHNEDLAGFINEYDWELTTVVLGEDWI